jgi:hypothetical protein
MDAVYMGYFTARQSVATEVIDRSAQVPRGRA